MTLRTTDCARARILAATNSLVDAYNKRVLHTLVQTYRLPSFTKLSADYLDIDGDGCVEPFMTAEFLNMQQPPGTPPHSLHLVVGALYELMRNFNNKDALMNHTPVVLEAVHDHHAVISTLQGSRFPLPRINFRWSIASGTTTMTRRQYPLRPAYASTYPHPYVW